MDDTFYTWGIGDFDTSKSLVKDKTESNISNARMRHTLLFNFLTHWNRNIPDIISGWNSEEFDMPYIINRIARILGEDQLKKLSLFNIKPESRDTIYNIMGTTQLDFYDSV